MTSDNGQENLNTYSEEFTSVVDILVGTYIQRSMYTYVIHASISTYALGVSKLSYDAI